MRSDAATSSPAANFFSVAGDKAAQGGGENRYLFITTAIDAAMFPEPRPPHNTNYVSVPDSLWTDEDRANKALNDAHAAWREKIAKARKLSDELNARFADWYYVISAKSFEDLSLTRSDLIKEKASS